MRNSIFGLYTVLISGDKLIVMWEVVFNDRVYKLPDEKAEAIQRAYQDLLDAEDSMRVGFHQVLMAVVQKAGVPVRTFLDAEIVAAQL